MPPPPYVDRRHAGQVLAEHLVPNLTRGGDVVVLALPRGGIPVAAPVAEGLRAPLDVLVLRRLGLPGQPEVPMGAVADVGGDLVVLRDEPLCRSARVPSVAFEATARRTTGEVRRQADGYSGVRSAVAVRGKVVVLVDDGLAPRPAVTTAVHAVRRQLAARVVVAVPVAAADTCTALAGHADDVVCPCTPTRLRCAGDAYRDFTQATDAELHAALRVHSSADERAA